LGVTADIRKIKTKLINNVTGILGDQAAKAVDLLNQGTSLEDLQAAIYKCEVLVSLTIDEVKAKQLKEMFHRIMPELAEASAVVRHDGSDADREARAIRMAKAKIIALASRDLGSKGDSVVDKLRNAPETKEGLREAVRQCHQLMNLIIGKAKADRITLNCNKVLDVLAKKSPS
jgi:ElaB/YqjD/DUF883 family membrane-anchored ribosome-binding protein